MKRVFTHFEENDLKEFEPEAKVGIIATVNPEGLPHITLITSLQAKSVDRLIWGQFCEGLSKQHVKTNPKTGLPIPAFGQPLNINGTDFYRERQIQFGLRMKF